MAARPVSVVREDQATCEALARRELAGAARWHAAFRTLATGGYVFVLEAPPTIDGRVRRAVDDLGALDVQVARCDQALVVWLPATNLSLGAEMEEAIAGRSGARVREKEILPAAAPSAPR